VGIYLELVEAKTYLRLTERRLIYILQKSCLSGNVDSFGNCQDGSQSRADKIQL
jgi:hypothetical protein